jgi:YfiH family protein
MGGKVTVYFSQKLPADPRERYRALAERGYAPLFTLYQEHGDNIIRLRKPYVCPGFDALLAEQPRGDALITDQPGLYIGVKTADCVPLLLWDETAGVVAAVHAGWRGTALNIAGKAVHIMRDEFGARDIRAAIGPCICKHCFVTRGDVPEAMPVLARPYIERFAPGQYRVDLPEINAALLREADARDVIMPRSCTRCESETYWSHRRHGPARGLQVSLIGLREADA